MSSDDYEVVVFKILSYLYSCLKAGKKVDVCAMRQLAGVNEAYFGSVVRHMQSKGLVEGFLIDMNGFVGDSPALAAMGDPAITMDGAAYARENSRMTKVRSFLGRAFETALETAVSAATRL